MKHKPIIIHADNLINSISEHTDADIADMLDMECVKVKDQFGDEYDECPAPTGYWRVSWPEHVTTPRYNSDASYSKLGDTLEDVAEYVGGPVTKWTDSDEYPEFDWWLI